MVRNSFYVVLLKNVCDSNDSIDKVKVILKQIVSSFALNKMLALKKPVKIR